MRQLHCIAGLGQGKQAATKRPVVGQEPRASGIKGVVRNALKENCRQWKYCDTGD